MKIEIDAHGLRVAIAWKSVMATLRILTPLVAGLLTFLSTPALIRLGHLLGFW